VILESCLNLSSYITDWNKSKLPKEYFIEKYNQISSLLINYTHNQKIYDGDELYGHLDLQRNCISSEIDYYMSICPDMYFSEYALAYLIESVRVVPNKYFVITPQVYKMWDWTWDVLVNPKYQDVPYSEWDKADLFDIRFQTKYNPEPLSLKPINVSKWANWFDLYSKSYYEELIPIPEDWHGYGPGDTYGMVITEYIKSKGVDFQQYVLEGQTIFEYPIGPLKQRNFASYYRDLIFTKTIPNQREEFEARFEEHVNNGIQKLIDKKII
jgi:hypothetical protein